MHTIQNSITMFLTIKENNNKNRRKTHNFEYHAANPQMNQYQYVKSSSSSSSSSSCRAASTEISDPLLPLLPIVHCFWQVFKKRLRADKEKEQKVPHKNNYRRPTTLMT